MLGCTEYTAIKFVNVDLHHTVSEVSKFRSHQTNRASTSHEVQLMNYISFLKNSIFYSTFIDKFKRSRNFLAPGRKCCNVRALILLFLWSDA
jgi:hypothetical protein